MNKLGGAMILVLALGTGGCGDDDSGSDGNGSSGGAGTGSSSNAGRGSGSGSGSGSGDLDAMDVAAGACQMMAAMGGSITCEGLDEYTACVQDACADEYEVCLGPDYMSGDFSGGMCTDYFDCITGSDDVCNNDCTIDGDCMSCFVDNLASCSSSCALPDCTGGGGSAGSGSLPMSDKTCDDLEACCNSLDGQNKDLCLMTWNGVKAGGDVVCGAAYQTFTALGCN